MHRSHGVANIHKWQMFVKYTTSWNAGYVSLLPYDFGNFDDQNIIMDVIFFVSDQLSSN